MDAEWMGPVKVVIHWDRCVEEQALEDVIPDCDFWTSYHCPSCEVENAYQDDPDSMFDSIELFAATRNIVLIPGTWEAEVWIQRDEDRTSHWKVGDLVRREG